MRSSVRCSPSHAGLKFSNTFVSLLRFQLLKTSDKLQLLNWSDTELPTFHQGSHVAEIVDSPGMLRPQVAKFKDLSFEEKVEEEGHQQLASSLSFLQDPLYYGISGSYSWPLKNDQLLQPSASRFSIHVLLSVEC